MALIDAVVAADLGQAGLEFVERVGDEVSLPLPPPPHNYSPASCRPEHGRFDSRPDEVVDVDDPHMPAKVNAGWWRMATEYDVVDDRREFLLCVDYSDPDEAEPEMAWIKVRLSDQWDLAASGNYLLEFCGFKAGWFLSNRCGAGPLPPTIGQHRPPGDVRLPRYPAMAA